MAARKNERSDLKQLDFLEGVLRRCPDHIPAMEALGDLYTRLGKYEEGLQLDRVLTDLEPENDTYWYNLACSLARVQQEDNAMEALRRAVAFGYDDAAWMVKDEDLTTLHAHDDFRLLVETIRARNQ